MRLIFRRNRFWSAYLSLPSRVVIGRDGVWQSHQSVALGLGPLGMILRWHTRPVELIAKELPKYERVK